MDEPLEPGVVLCPRCLGTGADPQSYGPCDLCDERKHVLQCEAADHIRLLTNANLAKLSDALWRRRLRCKALERDFDGHDLTALLKTEHERRKRDT